jgi:hypothetical protein
VYVPVLLGFTLPPVATFTQPLLWVAVAPGSVKLPSHFTVSGLDPLTVITGDAVAPFTVIVCVQEELLPPSVAVQ